jgi:hypothetical protein
MTDNSVSGLYLTVKVKMEALDCLLLQKIENLKHGKPYYGSHWTADGIALQIAPLAWSGNREESA